MRVLRSLAIAAGILATAGGTAAGRLHVVLQVPSGLAPGLPGLTLLPGAALLDANGGLVFSSALVDAAGNDQGHAVWRADPQGEVALVDRVEGEGADVVVYGANDAGQALVARLALGGSWHLLGPGLDAHLAPVFQPPTLTAVGEVVVEASVTTQGAEAEGLWRNTPGEGFALLAASTDPAPGLPGETLSYLGEHAVDSDGDVVFVAGLQPFGSNEFRLFAPDGAGGFAPVVSSEAAPDLPDASLCGLNAPAIAAPGRVAFRASLCGRGISFDEDAALFASEGGGFHPIAREGERAVGFNPGRVFSEFSPPVVGASGAVAFIARTRGTQGRRERHDRDAGLWIYRPRTGLRLVARIGDPLPDRPRRVLHSILTLSINAAGDVVFLAGLDDESTALEFVPARGALRTLVAVGDRVTLAGERRIVSSVGTYDPEPASANVRILDDDRRVAATLYFHDGSGAALLLRAGLPRRH